jgi:hypothetical protein
MEQGAEKPRESRRLLVLLLLLVMAILGYLYFFTSLLKPREEAAKPEASQTMQVKKPLPPRTTETAGTGAEPPAADKPAASKGAEPVTAGTAAPAAPGAAEKGVPAKGTAAAPSQKEGGPAPVSKPAAPATPPPKGKGGEKSPPPTASKPVEPSTGKAGADTKVAAMPAKAADKPKPAPGKDAKAAAQPQKAGSSPAVKAKTPTAEAAKSSTKKQGAAHAGGQYTLLIGEFVPDKRFAAIQAKVRKVVGPVLTTTPLQKVEPMHRLFVGEYAGYEEAAAELQRLKSLTADAFMIEKTGKYLLFAGSYYDSSLVEKQKQRLSAKGVTVKVLKADLPVRVIRLTAGRFASQGDAQKAVEKLKKDGIKAQPIKRKP